MDKQLRILIVDDSPDEVVLTVRALQRAGYEIQHERVETKPEMKSALEEKEWELVISDYSMPRFDGLSALRQFQQHKLEIPFILVSGRVGEETAVDVLTAGAHNYVFKDKLFGLAPVVEKEIQEATVRRHTREATEALKASETKLRETADLLEAVLRNAVDGILTLDADGRVFTFNLAAEEIFRQPFCDVEGKHISALIPSVEQDDTANRVSGRSLWPKAPDRGIRIERPVRREDGSIFQMEMTIREMKVGDRKMFTGIIRDITEHRRIETALRVSEKKIGSILESITSLFFALDVKWCFTYVNSPAAEVFKRDAEELMGQNIWDAIPGAEALLFEPFLDAASEQKRVDFEGYFPEVDGWFEIHVYPSPEGMSVHLTDITKRKHTEEQLLQVQKMDTIGKLTGGIAHEFSNLLTVIGGYAEMAQRKLEDTARVKECLTEISKAALRSTQLTSQMLAFARKQFLKPKVVSIKQVIADQEMLLRPFLGNKITLHMDEADDDCFVRVDPAQLSQAILNLAINACQAMKGGGNLTIGTRIGPLRGELIHKHPDAGSGQYVAVFVADTGDGIDDESLKHIFEPFFTTKESGQGTGLGLSMVDGMVGQSGGIIDVETEVGEGTAFTIYLPQVDGGVDRDRFADGVSDEPATGGTVLIAEEKLAVRRLARVALEEAGYEVLEAKNGSKAAELFSCHEGEVRLLLTSVSIPVMDGITLARSLTDKKRDLKVIFMAKKSDAGVFSDGCPLKDIVVIEKPFDTDHLVGTIGEVLNSVNPGTGS